jgi:hypothetical protein
MADENVSVETLRESVDNVKNAAMKIGKAMYGQSGGSSE